MKTIISLFIVFLMTDGGSCRQAEFVDNSRVVVEGNVKDTQNLPLKNGIISVSNGINNVEASIKIDGSFKVSVPITDVGTSVTINEKQIVKLISNNNKITYGYQSISIPKEVTYAKFEAIVK